MTLIRHHVKYKEIHGYNEYRLMDKSDHMKLHSRLRVEGRCNISPSELQRLSRRDARRGLLRRDSIYFMWSTPDRETFKEKWFTRWEIFNFVRPDIIAAAVVSFPGWPYTQTQVIIA